MNKKKYVLWDFLNGEVVANCFAKTIRSAKPKFEKRIDSELTFDSDYSSKKAWRLYTANKYGGKLFLIAQNNGRK